MTQDYVELRRTNPVIDVVAFLLGSVLLLAAVMKLEQHSTSAISSPWPVAQVTFEVTLGACLVALPRWRTTWIVSSVCFSGFSVVLGTKWWIGATDCGCFGELSIPPGTMLLFDVVAVFLSLTCLNIVARTQSARASKVQWVGGIIFVGLLLILARLPRAEGDQIAEGLFLKGRYMLARPEAWLQHPLPLLPYIDIERELSTGDWNVLVYRPGCATCDALLNHPRGEPLTSLVDDGTRLAVISLTSDGRDRLAWGPEVAEFGELTSSYDWIISTPLLLNVSNGNVVRVVTPGE